MDDANAGQGRLRPIGAPSDNEETKRADLMATFEADPALVAYRVPGFLGVYLRNRWLQKQLNPTASATAADLLDHYTSKRPSTTRARNYVATAAAQALANLPAIQDLLTSLVPGKELWSVLSTGPARTGKV